MRAYLSLIKFSHTIFALPFAFIGLALGFKDFGMFDWVLSIQVLLCMIFARSAAMAFNRWADVKYDRINPRTNQREIPKGIITEKNAQVFIILNCIAFIATTYFINRICFYLSPVALIIILGYSLTKRWTFLCHLFLGVGLALAPIGAYLSVTGVFSLIPLLFSGIVFYWVAGFDIIYALQDEEFDKAHKLFSIPSKFGKGNALKISRVLHLFCALLLIFTSLSMQQKYQEINRMVLWSATAFFICMLIYQHLLVKPNDLSRVNLAFFTTNGVASVVYGSLIIANIAEKL